MNRKYENVGSLVARPYQVEIAAIAKQESVIVKLNTGLGKTFIAVIVIKNHLPETFRPLSQGGKRIVFLAKTVHLVYQHAEFLRSQLPVAHDDIGIFHGQVAPGVWIDSWDQNVWRAQLDRHKVLVATAGVFRDVLNHRKISLNNICLIVFDECHHADPDTGSDFTDICQHLNSYPPGRWLPDYSRGPKVLGLTASVVNNVKRGESLDVKLQRMEKLMRARLVTSVDSSILKVTGIREHHIIHFQPGGNQACIGERYWRVYEALTDGVKKLGNIPCNAIPETINLESLLDKDKKILEEKFYSVMQFNEVNPKKFRRVLMQCITLLEEWGIWCCDVACGETEKAFRALLSLTTLSHAMNPGCVVVINTCVSALARARQVFEEIKQNQIRSLTRPSAPSDPAWGDWILAHFPMTLKLIQLLRLLIHFKNKFDPECTGINGLTALVLVKSRISTMAVCRLICEISELSPTYAGLKASYCVSANPTRNLASMTTGEQLEVLDGFRRGAYNVLVATNVIEEGLDIRSCNVVIKADSVTNFRSFIQSQGRARAEHSHFVLLTDDKVKCKNNVDSFINTEQQLAAALNSRCVDLDTEENCYSSQVGDVFQIAKQSYMPFGLDGPRVTPSSAPGVLMRYLSILKTDSSYVMKILYSNKKVLGGYRVQLLFPPPSPLQDIITGPCASEKLLALQLARVKACQKLHECGLLNDELLPIDFRQLVELSKNGGGHAPGSDLFDSYMQNLLSKMHRMHVQNNDQDQSDKDLTSPPSMQTIMSQAQMLLTPLEDEFISLATDDDGIPDPGILPASSVVNFDNDVDEELDEIDYPYIVTCSSEEDSDACEYSLPMKIGPESVPKLSGPNTRLHSDMTLPSTPLQQQTLPLIHSDLPSSQELMTKPALARCADVEMKVDEGEKEEEEEKVEEEEEDSVGQRKSKKSRRDAMNVYEIDDELPLSRKKKAPAVGGQSKARFYRIHKLYSLSAPYQGPIQPNQIAYLYTWRLPSAEDVAKLTKVDPHCFPDTSQTIGLLFSQPISQFDFVCRLPLYLQWGVARVRVIKTAALRLSVAQIALATRTHEILSHLSTDINTPINFDLNFSGDSLNFFTPPCPNADTNGEAFRFTPTKQVNAIDPFNTLTFNPDASQICALFLIVRLPTGEMDEIASQALVNWADEKDQCVGKSPQNVTDATIAPLQGGIVSRYGLQLSALDPDDWTGRLVRPINLPSKDPAGFAVAGVNKSGLNGSSHIPNSMLTSLSESVNQSMPAGQHFSYAAFSRIQYGKAYAKLAAHKGLNADLPLVSIIRISRHLNASIVSAGFRESTKEVFVDDRMPDLCILHPLNAWLWLILCLSPTVLYQLTRSVAACELSARLIVNLYDEEGEEKAEEDQVFPQFGLPDGNFLMPDRASVPLRSIPPLQKFLEDKESNAMHAVYTDQSELHLDAQVELSKQVPCDSKLVPDSERLLEALTAMGANDAINLERLELLGDSLLKFAASLLVYATSPASTDEGQLTYLRTGHISNANLHRLSKRTGLFCYFVAGEFKPAANYLPPSYALTDLITARETHDPRIWVKMYDKSVADSMEALLGTFLLHLTPSISARLLSYFGLASRPLELTRCPEQRLAVEKAAGMRNWQRTESWVALLLDDTQSHLDPDLISDDIASLTRRNAEVERMISENLPPPPETSGAPKPTLTDAATSSRDVIRSLEDKRLHLAALESILGYKFRRIRILIQATTHSSSLQAYHWGCYQRLEFLGDAILDFVVTQRIFDSHPNMNPGELTDLRTALVSNINLAIVAVRHGIHKYLDQTDQSLWQFISNFSEVVLNRPYKLWHLEDEYNDKKESLSYKVLADMFEAIIGAIYVDSGGTNSVVTGVIYRLLENEFKQYGDNLPIDPIRMMHEIYPKLEISATECVFVENEVAGKAVVVAKPEGVGATSKREKQAPKKTICSIKATHCGKTIQAHGHNLRAAKLSLAKQLGVPFDI